MCFQIYLKYIIKEQRKKLGQMELYLLSFSIIHKEVTTTLLQQFLDKFQNAFRDSEQRLSLSVMNNPLATKGPSLLLLYVWRFSDTGCDHITHRSSRRHARELFSKCLVHLANRILKPGGGCIFGGTLPGGSLGKSLQVTPLCHSNKAMWPVGPMCVKLCCSQCGNVNLLAFQRTGGKLEMRQHFCPAREPLR